MKSRRLIIQLARCRSFIPQMLSGLAMLARPGILFLCFTFLNDAAFSQNAISFKIGKSIPMAPGDVAGAEVRVGNWNFLKDISDGNVATFETINDKDGKVVAGMVVSFTGGQSTIGLLDWSDTPGSNDAALFNGAYDQNEAPPSFITVTGIPFAKYDVYFYHCDDNEAGDKRAGSFQIGDVTYYIRGGISNPNVDGTGYVRSTAQSANSPIDQGNYVKFEGLTGPKINIIVLAVDAGDAALRNKVSGFQIVEVK